jgi:hypothetical protein
MAGVPQLFVDFTDPAFGVGFIDGEPAAEEVAWKNALNPGDKWRFEV